MPSSHPTISIYFFPLVVGEQRQLDLVALLSSSERDSAARFSTSRLRGMFEAGRGQLREILGAHVGLPGRELSLSAGVHGKPELHGPVSPLAFNISHAGDLGVCALSAECSAIGVDIEQMHVRPGWSDTACLVFREDELEYLRRCPARDQERAFYRLWTCKEAVMKADGRGFALDPRSFRVSESAWAPDISDPERAAWADTPAARWRVQGVVVNSPEFTATVAYDAPSAPRIDVAWWPRSRL